MNIFKKIISIIVPAIMMGGCSLSEKNLMVPVADNYYVDEAGFSSLLNSSYSYTRNFWGSKHGWRLHDMGTDLWMNGGDGQTIYGLYSFTPSGDAFSGVWNNFYLGITSCNTLLDRIDNVEMTEAARNPLKGEALFLRALYYHVLAMNFGDVPLVLHEVTGVETTAHHTPVKDVYAQCINDLKEAEKLLPETESEWGHASKYAATALMARIYLWMEQYAEAAGCAKKVIDSGRYELVDDFASLWGFDGQKNKEAIFAVCYAHNLTFNNGDGNQGQALFNGRYENGIKGMIRDIPYGRPYRNFMPTRHQMDLAAENLWWDSRFNKSFRTVWLTNNPDQSKYLPLQQFGDTALWVPPFRVSSKIKEMKKDKYTIYDIDSYFDASSENGEVKVGKGELFPSLVKWDDPNRAAVSAVNGSTDFIVLRLAEMYMIAAEALMYENDPEALNYFNAIRKRAAWTNELYEKVKLTSMSQLNIELILQERAMEFTGEMMRWPDLKRTGKLIDWVKLYNYEGRPNISAKHLLRPIPTTMMDRVTNKEEFTQNPEW